ncbi:hypothetical protein [Staphylospora marina]|uniref:hypothetical protein n=1 Tax=Staphylospora marina TaxID=2490858 RepID=UPI000F5BBDCE|nr:hypothetical protein [Staphylospora marina]
MISRFEERDNDMYFMEVCKELIVVNDNDSGLKMLNRLLEPVGRLELFDDVSIYHAWSDGNRRMVLFCAENGCLVSVDLTERKSTVIPLEGKILQTVFSPVHKWLDNGLMVLDYAGNTYKVDISEGSVRSLAEGAGMFGNAVSLMRQHRLIHFEEGMLLLETHSGGNIGVFDWTGRLVANAGKPEGNWHSVGYHDGCLIFVDETKIVGVEDHEIRFALEPESSEYFLKVKMTDDHLWVLSSDPSNPQKSRISQYQV